MKKPGVKIAFSVACLAAALALAVFTVFAWFTTNRRADTDGITSQTTSGDVEIFLIKCYKAVASGESYTMDGEVTKENGEYLMTEYSPKTTTSSDTAVIIEITIKFFKNKAGTVPLSAKLNHTEPYKTDKKSFSGDIWDNYLSNAVTMRYLVKENGTFKINPQHTETLSFVTDTFIGDGEEKDRFDTTRQIYDIDYSDEENSLYLLMDYNPTYINVLYSIMLKAYPNATLNSKIKFEDDITFVLG